jgi:hypothetical protein
LSSLAEQFLNAQAKDLSQVEAYYEKWLPAKELLEQHRSLLKTCHQLAYVVALWKNSLDNLPPWVEGYLLALGSDSIQSIDSVALGGLKSFHLFLRSCIEDFLRYAFYYHHEIEHEILQSEPKGYKTIKDLLDWTKNHPRFKAVPPDLVLAALEVLSSEHAELSRTVHTTTVDKLQLVEGISIIHSPFQKIMNEVSHAKRVSSSLVFLFSAFHLKTYRQMSLGRRTCINECLNRDQVRALGGLTQARK